MRRRLVLLTVTALAALVAAAANAQARADCGAGYVTAHLSWGVKCLRAGEFCKVANTQYRRYGFTCPATGHLKRS